MDVRVAVDATGAADAAARFVARRLRDAVRRRGRASVAVSGGSTPAAMFDVLATLEVPWPAVTVFQVDERVASDGDLDRNAVQLAHHLTDVVPLRAEQVRWMPVTALDLRRAAKRYAAFVAAAAPLDVVHLGLGDDGHTASWPPGDPVIDSSLVVELCGEFNGRRRMTLTPGPVNGARCRVVLAAGASKRSMVERLLAGDGSIPIARVRRAGTFLFVDRAAAPDAPVAADR